MKVDWDASRYTAPGNDELYRLYSELEFKSLLAKLQLPTDMPLFANERKLEGTYRSYVSIVDPPDFTKLAKEIRNLAPVQAGTNACHPERSAAGTQSRDRGNADLRIPLALAGDTLGISAAKGTGLSLHLGALAHEPVRSALDQLWLSGARIAAYDAKRVLRALEAHGMPLQLASESRELSLLAKNQPATGWRTIHDDAMIALHLLDPSGGFANVADSAAKFLGVTLGEDAAVYADATLQLLDYAKPELEARGQLQLYEEIEVPLAPILAKMEHAGVSIDPSELQKMSVEIDTAMAKLQKHIYDFAGEEFNIGSPQQLGNILFEKLRNSQRKEKQNRLGNGR